MNQSRGTRLFAAAALLFTAVQLCTVQADDGLPYDYLVLQLDWMPNKCANGICAQQPFGAFSVNGLIPTNTRTDGGVNPAELGTGCTTETFDASKISPEVIEQLQCIAYDGTGNVQAPWRNMWERQGRCSGMDLNKYFTSMVDLFNRYNPNRALADEGMILPADNPGLDRNTTLQFLDKVFAARTFAQCYPTSVPKRLQYIDVCIIPDTLKSEDCPWWAARSDPNLDTLGGMMCDGPLQMLQGVAPTEACAASYPRTIPGAVLAAAPPAPTGDGEGNPSGGGIPGVPPPDTGSGGSGSNVGAIAGAVVGVVVALVASIAGFLFWRRRRRAAAGAASPQQFAMPRDTIMRGDAAAAAEAGALDSLVLATKQKSVDKSFLSSRASTGYASKSQASVLSNQDPMLSYITASQIKSGSTVRSNTSAISRGLSDKQTAMWMIPFEELQISKAIGDGSFGRVYAGEWHSTPVAIKLLLGDDKPAQGSMAAPSQLLLKMEEEAGLMLAMRHPNCCQILGLCEAPPCLVTEYCERGSLTDCLQAAGRDPAMAAQLTWARRISMAIDAAKGMLYLHTRTPPIIHRDLKSPNLLVDKHWVVKVCDFNLSRFVSDAAGNSSAAAMNPRWLAPEVMKGEGATQAADVYSFAIVMHELMTWELPWVTGNAWQLVQLITSGGRLEIKPAEELPGPDRLSPGQLGAYVALMQRCWAQEPRERPGFKQVIEELRSILESVRGDHPDEE